MGLLRAVLGRFEFRKAPRADLGGLLGSRIEVCHDVIRGAIGEGSNKATKAKGRDEAQSQAAV